VDHHLSCCHTRLAGKPNSHLTPGERPLRTTGGHHRAAQSCQWSLFEAALQESRSSLVGGYPLGPVMYSSFIDGRVAARGPLFSAHIRVRSCHSVKSFGPYGISRTQYCNPAHAAVETDASEWVTPANTSTSWTLPHSKFNLSQCPQNDKTGQNSIIIMKRNHGPHRAVGCLASIEIIRQGSPRRLNRKVSPPTPAMATDEGAMSAMQQMLQAVLTHLAAQAAREDARHAARLTEEREAHAARLTEEREAHAARLTEEREAHEAQAAREEARHAARLAEEREAREAQAAKEDARRDAQAAKEDARRDAQAAKEDARRDAQAAKEDARHAARLAEESEARALANCELQEVIRSLLSAAEDTLLRRATPSTCRA